MTDESKQSIKGDRALGAGDEDRLGFREVAKRIAVSLVDRSTEDGLVIGLEGPWGSGKSSLLFLIDDELGKLPEHHRPTIIKFRPWLIGKRDALIASLFSDLFGQLDEMALKNGDATGVSVAKAKEAGEALRSFVKGLSKTGAFVEFVGKASGFGLVEMLGEGIKSAGEATEGEAAPPPLSELKDKLAHSLRELDHRFVVTIDDVDRLEPTEVIEILRLVRSVVDLPNMIYLLCYDSGILAHSIEKSAGVQSGHAYLEKIVQLTVMVPQPEPLQLRQWFADELHEIASSKNEDERLRLEGIIDFEGGRQLRTPRSVVRALDAMRFFWPPLSQAKADLADLVWLQLIKDGDTNLYRWIEDYCATSATVSLGTARVDDDERKRVLDKLLGILGKDNVQDAMFKYQMAEQLLGVEVDYAKDGVGLKIFSNISVHDHDKAVRDKRLASPDHYRLYFALASPSHVLSQEEFSSIWIAAEVGAEQAGEALLNLQSLVASGNLTKADLLFERVKGGAYEVLSPTQCENILVACSQVMDRAYWRRPFDVFWVSSFWDRAQRLVPSLLSRLDKPQRDETVAMIFKNGVAIGWLTSLLRHEIFAHGRYRHRAKPQSDWLFTDEQLDLIIPLMVSRYEAMSIQDLLSSPNPISVLFAWRQSGDEEGPRRLVEACSASDHGFVETMERFASPIQSSDRGRFKVLKEENIGPFMEFDSAKHRISLLVDHPVLGDRAKVLLMMLEDGSSY
ncbi:KAP family P-loop NTPase fold protein [Methylobacterium sp. Leaf113]|uniref:KAP family P-loop NTPase fold protein n=1 Tax=Methylobacterium sp. Leaf113 TaxID=1736259 RepID=UPI0009ECA2F4|nr:P-loop NTPase fold protein [Methylobacterium sp. Leaf113]